MSLLDTASLIVTPNAYKEGKLYSVIPSDGSGDLSVTRATTATRVNSAGLVELTPYNLRTYSEDFSNAAWAKSNSIVSSNVITAPSGTATADKLIQNTTSTFHYISQAFTASAGQQYTHSIYAKAGEYYGIYFFGNNPTTGAGAATRVNLNTGTFALNNHNATIEDVGDGWYRITTFHACPTTSLTLNIYVLQTENAVSEAGDGTSGIYLWGAQLVEGTEAKDYYPTETRLNIPRLDYSLGSCPSILVEPQRTNLFTYSEQFDNADWTKTNATITANTTISPDGNNNADTYNVVSTNANLIHQNKTLTTGAYSISVYAKKGSSNIIRLFNVSSGTSAAWFDLNLGQVIGTVNGGTASIENAGNGWYRCVYKGTSITSGFTGIGLSDTANSTTASIGSSVFIWGAQLEAGAYATSYIPTTSASVTRNQDSIGITNGSFLPTAYPFTIYSEGIFKEDNSYLFSFLNNTLSTLYLSLYILTNKIVGVARNGATSMLATSTNNFSLNTFYKVAVVFTSSTVDLYVNGNLEASVANTLAFDTSINDLLIGQLRTASDVGTRTPIKSLVMWNEALTDEQLEALTGEGFDTYQLMAENLNYILQ